MAILDYSDVTVRKYILHDNEPYEVLSHWVFRKQMRKPVNQTKLRNLISGRVIEITFHQNDKVPEAEISTRPIKFLYSNKNENWFCAPEKPSDRFMIAADIIGDQLKFIKQNAVIDGVVFDERIIGVRIPVKVELAVTEAAPAVKGNTSGNATKIVKLETGTTVNVPLFVNEGDILRINTETGDYTERVEKS